VFTPYAGRSNAPMNCLELAAHPEDSRRFWGFLLLESLLQFSLGLARPENQDNGGITKMGNDLVTVSREMPGGFFLARIIRGNLLIFESACGRFAETSRLTFLV
jgi:hypothetical protein